MCRQAKGARHAHSSDAPRRPRPARHQCRRRAAPGTASLSGAVQAPKPFRGAQVRMMNVDRNVLFMVYTSGGRYQAAHLLPGRYEVTVRTTGLAGDPQTIVLEAGATRTLDFALREQAVEPARQGEFGFTTRAASDVKLVSYDELYPREPGREILEKQCMYCHGKNFFPSKQYPEVTWNAFIDVMVKGGSDRWSHGPGRCARRPGSRDPARVPDEAVRPGQCPARLADGRRIPGRRGGARQGDVRRILLAARQADRRRQQAAAHAAAALRSRRQRLVHRPQRAQPHRSRRSAHRRVQGLDDAGSEGRPPRPDRRRRRARVVGRDRRLLPRPARSQDRLDGPLPHGLDRSAEGARRTARSWTASRTCGSP